MALIDGLYDLLLTEGLSRSLAGIDPKSADVQALGGGTAEFLVDAITRQLGAILDDVPKLAYLFDQIVDAPRQVRHFFDQAFKLIVTDRWRWGRGWSGSFFRHKSGNGIS